MLNVEPPIVVLAKFEVIVLSDKEAEKLVVVVKGTLVTSPSVEIVVNVVKEDVLPLYPIVVTGNVEDTDETLVAPVEVEMIFEVTEEDEMERGAVVVNETGEVFMVNDVVPENTEVDFVVPVVVIVVKELPLLVVASIVEGKDVSPLPAVVITVSAEDVLVVEIEMVE